MPTAIIWVLGRVDDVMNVSGHRLSTMEVESALVRHPAVAEAAVVGKPHEITGQAVCCFVTLKKGDWNHEELGKELRQWVAHEIGAFARPEEIRFTDALPKTRSGKIMRRLLREIVTSQYSHRRCHDARRSQRDRAARRATGRRLIFINIAATLFLTGVVWALQVVQLPVWFEAEHHLDIALHRRRNTILMTPPMVIEGVTAVWLYSVAPMALILLMIIWIVTFARIIPLFRRLSSGYDTGIREPFSSLSLGTGCVPYAGPSAVGSCCGRSYIKAAPAIDLIDA